MNNLVSRLDDLREYIEDTEETVQMTVNTQRNNLIEIRLLLVVIIACLNIPFSIHGNNYDTSKFLRGRIVSTK